MGFLYSQLFVTPPRPTTLFTDQTVIVTGSNVGLGLEAARHLTRLNAARVILAVRNEAQGNEAKKSIEASTSRSVVEVWHLDLSSFASVKAFAQKARAELPRLDVLLLNASIATKAYTVFEDYESTITVNVLSTFLLLFLLMPIMQKTATLKPPPSSPPRISIVTSEVHGYVTFPPSAYPTKDGALLPFMSDPEKIDVAGKRYSESKLLQVLCLRAITPSLTPPKTGVVLNMLNPGLCESALNREGNLMVSVMKYVLGRSTEVGSRTLVAGCSAGWESHGGYMHDAVVADGALSPWVKTDEGREMQDRVWKEVREVLERVSPGCTKVLDE